MKKFTNYLTTKTFLENNKLPAGGYICKITGVETKTYRSANAEYPNLVISFDISEGDYRGFYADNFSQQGAYTKSWKGAYHLNIPQDDGSSRSELEKKMFKTVIKAVEGSNAGYRWNWDENTLIGKTVGIVFRSEEWEFEGRRGWKTSPYRFVTSDTIRTGEFGIPKPKPLASPPEKSFI